MGVTTVMIVSSIVVVMFVFVFVLFLFGLQGGGLRTPQFPKLLFNPVTCGMNWLHTVDSMMPKRMHACVQAWPLRTTLLALNIVA